MELSLRRAWRLRDCFKGMGVRAALHMILRCCREAVQQPEAVWCRIACSKSGPPRQSLEQSSAFPLSHRHYSSQSTHRSISAYSILLRAPLPFCTPTRHRISP